MKLLFALPVISFAIQAGAQPSRNEAAIRRILDNETATWNKGDGVGYSRDFAATGSFTNIRGQFFTGYPAFVRQHEAIFQSFFKNTTLTQDIVSLTFVRPDVAVVETLTSVSGIVDPSFPIRRDDKGRLRTRLLQVVAREKGTWKIVAYHNVDVKPGVPVPEPK